MITLILLVLVVILIAYILRNQLNGANRRQSALLLKQDLDKLSQDVNGLKDNINNQLSDRIDRSQAIMVRSLQRQYSESSKLISEVTKSLIELKESNKQVISITDELKTLQNVLQNPKQRGVLGEYYLESLLENVLPKDRFKLQYKLGKNEAGIELICDAVILLDKNLVLPIDSKFSLENYNRLIEAKNDDKKQLYSKLFKADVKKRIDETAKYISPANNTMDFAFMFIPSEAIYYDLLINRVGSRDLIEYAFREKNVIIVSPTSFLAYLQTVLQGLRSLHIEEQSKVIQQRVGDLGRHLETYQSFMDKLGSSLNTTVNSYNLATKELSKIDKDIIKVTNQDKVLIAPTTINGPIQEG